MNMNEPKEMDHTDASTKALQSMSWEQFIAGIEQCLENGMKPMIIMEPAEKHSTDPDYNPMLHSPICHTIYPKTACDELRRRIELMGQKETPSISPLGCITIIVIISLVIGAVIGWFNAQHFIPGV